MFNTFLSLYYVIFWRVVRHIDRSNTKMSPNMKKVFLQTLAIAMIGATLLNGCADYGDGDRDYPDNPQLTNVATSDCHTFTDILAAKDMNTDSVVVSFSLDNNVMSVTHYNMVLDCGSGEHIATTIERVGDTITVTENVGEQGRTNCVCLYDNSFQIMHLPPRPFTLVVKIVADCFGTTGQTIVYQQTFE